MSLQAGLMSLGTFLSRILGFFRDLLLASLFSKTETDIFFVAFRFPNFFRRLLGEGTFSASITPALTEALEKKNPESAKALYHSFFTLLFSLTLALTLLGVIFMPWIMNSLFGNSPYAEVAGKLEKTILVGRMVFSYLFFVSFYSYFMSVAQVFGRFFVPALAPAFFNLSLIVFAWMPQSWWPFPSMALGWAVIAGGMLQLIPVLYLIKKLNWTPSFSFKKNPDLFKLLKRVFPSMIALSGLSCIGLINVYFAGWLEEGANSYIYYADRLMEFPRSLIAVSLGTALIPELTRQYTNHSIEALKNTVSYYLRFLLFLTLPFALLFFLQAEFIIQLLFGRGQFDQDSVIQTAQVLTIYTLVLIFSSLSRVLSSAFFAVNKNWIIVRATLLFVGFHFASAWILTSNYGLKGLAGASSLSSMLFFFILIFSFFYQFGKLNLKAIGALIFNVCPGLFALALVLQAAPHIFYQLHFFILKHFTQKEIAFYEDFKTLNYIADYPLYSFLIFIFSCGLGAFLYLKISLLLKEEMGAELLKLLSKFKKLTLKNSRSPREN